MIQCGDCGQRNADSDTFCGSCGGFLEWSAKRVVKAAPKDGALLAAAQAEVAASSAQGLYGRSFDALMGSRISMDGRTLDRPTPTAGATAPASPAAAPPKPPEASAPPKPPAPPAPPKPPVPPTAGPPAPPQPPAPPAPPKPPAPPAPPKPPVPPAPPKAPPPVMADDDRDEEERAAAERAKQAAMLATPVDKPRPPKPPAPPKPAPPRPPEPPDPSSGKKERTHSASSTAYSAQAKKAPPAPTRTLPRPPADIGEMTPAERAAARPKRITKSAPSREYQPGDKICGPCGEANAPTRRFCSRCGSSLDRAQVVELPWWQQLIWRSKGPSVRKLGPDDVEEKRRNRSATTVLRNWQQQVRRFGIYGIIAVTALVGIYPPLRTTVAEWAGGVGRSVSALFVSDQKPVRPVGLLANASLPGHPAALAFDGFTDTYWAAPVVQGYAPPAITVDLGGVSIPTTMIIHSGAADAFTAYGRPSILNVVYDNQRSETVTVADTPEAQVIPLRLGFGASTLRIEVVSTTGGQPDVAIGEIELFARGR